ncbi:glycosyl transferase family 1 [Gluconobacter potus]|uniref:Glycosyl transferase family 1 n=1 Tax=Gluconobacter potus TaxID=2724927 RepID=A0A149QT18_9PROT|nr:glycosyltransferase [Gluconobacter potus]KXV00459.1 glycosyl transferase family 1 [Gluconobacter potus]
MKIAYIINSLECGGAQLPIPDIVSVLKARGGDVTVFALARKDGLAIPLIEAAGIPVRVREGTTRDHIAAYRWLRDEMEAFQPDLIWTSLSRATLLGQLVALRHKTPTVHWQHCGRLKKANAFLLRLCRPYTTLWVADSQSVITFAAKELGLTDNFVAWPIFRANPDAPVATPWKDGEVVRVGSLGRLNPVKAYDILCEAVALLKDHPDLPPFRLQIAGDGPEHAALQARITAGNLPIDLLGYESKPFDFLKTLHLYVQSSHWEGMCVAGHEAMSCGLPVVATPAGELPSSILDGETGRIVPFDNAPALAAALADLISRPADLAAMGARSRKRVLERFGPEAFVRHGNAVLDRIPGF